MNVSIEISDLRRVQVRPGDVFVYRAPAGFTAQHAHRMIERFRAVFPDNPLVIVDHDGELIVVENEDPIERMAEVALDGKALSADVISLDEHRRRDDDGPIPA